GASAPRTGCDPPAPGRERCEQRPPARTRANRGVASCGYPRGPAEQLDLLPCRRRDQPAQLDVLWITGQCVARLAERRVDRSETALQQRDGGRSEPVALRSEGAGQLIAGLLVLRLYRQPALPHRAVMGGKGRQEAVDSEADHQCGRGGECRPPPPFPVSHFPFPDARGDTGPQIPSRLDTLREIRRAGD